MSKAEKNGKVARKKYLAAFLEEALGTSVEKH
jgi:hypothetical protein